MLNEAELRELNDDLAELVGRYCELVEKQDAEIRALREARDRVFAKDDRQEVLSRNAPAAMSTWYAGFDASLERTQS